MLLGIMLVGAFMEAVEKMFKVIFLPFSMVGNALNMLIGKATDAISDEE